MNSLQFYLDIYQNEKVTHDKVKLMNIDVLVQCIIDEIMPHYNINESPFISETIKSINIVKLRKRSSSAEITIYSYDAYIILKALSEKIMDTHATVVTEEYFRCAKDIFEGNRISNKEIIEINKLLEKIKREVEDQKRNLIARAEVPLNRQSIESVKVNCETTRINNGIYNDKNSQTMIQRRVLLNENNTKSIERSNNCRKNVQEWRNETSVIQQKLNDIQPMVGKVLKKMMDFSNELTENYVLQFAKMQIELFNLITDNLSYHSGAILKYDNQDYANAVSNYQEFLDIIVDNLSAFGIEEISSREGTEFDGSIHEVVNNMDFSPRLSRVKNSVCSGFRYKNIIIQKEKIRV